MSVDEKASYYDQGGIEVIDVIRAKLTPEQFEGYLLGNQIKYSLRFNWKTPGKGRIRDAEKSSNYSKMLCSLLSESTAGWDVDKDLPDSRTCPALVDSLGRCVRCTVDPNILSACDDPQCSNFKRES